MTGTKYPVISARVFEIVADQLGIPVDKVQSDSYLTGDDGLGADSMDGVEMMLELEDVFETHIPDEDTDVLYRMQMGDVAAYLVEKREVDPNWKDPTEGRNPIRIDDQVE